MLTNNFAACSLAIFGGSNASIVVLSGGSSTFFAEKALQAPRMLSAYGSGVSQVHIVVGSSSDAPTSGDHCLVSDVTSSLTFVSGASSNGVSDGKCNHTISATFRNDSASNVSVSEIALYYDNYFGNNIELCQSGMGLMLSRDVIDTVTIAPGKTATFTVNIAI